MQLTAPRSESRRNVQSLQTSKSPETAWSATSRGEGGYSKSHPGQSADTQVGIVPTLFQLISVASLARIGNQSPCPLVLKPKGSPVIPRVSHTHHTLLPCFSLQMLRTQSHHLWRRRSFFLARVGSGFNMMLTYVIILFLFLLSLG